jgi:pimeloyl-ACP methyl ester carboxylesterase
MLRERRFYTGTVEVNYVEGPDNESPVVVLHAGAGSWRLGQRFVEALVPAWHVYAPDFRGHGRGRL